MLDRIDRYEIKREIGHGATSTVYYAYDPRVGREVAIKLMLDPAITNMASRRRFEHEAKAIATLEHPTIVPLYDFGDHEGQPYLVMRYMAGGSLGSQLRQGPIPLDDTMVILSRVASALDQAHQRGIIHCDIKPDNILFDQYGNGFLSDFGIVKLPPSKATPVRVGDTGATGTPAYMSPEQIQGERKLDGRSDVYALGAVLYETLTGDSPFKGDSPVAIALKHVSEPPPSLIAARPDLPPEVDGIIQRAMSKRRQDRYPTAGALVRDLLVATGQDIKPVLDGDRSVLTLRSAVPDPSSTHELEPGTLPLTSRLQKKGVWTSGLFAGGFALIALIGLLTVTPISPLRESTALNHVMTPFGGGMGRIAFDSEIGGVPDLYFMNADGSDMARMITEVGNNRGADWSPDGRLILFRSRNGGNRVIYVMNPDGSALTPLTTPETSNYWPVWSPDGSRIAFVSERDGNAEIYVMNADGSDVVRLTDNASADYQPAWSPDGQQIVFHSGRDGDLNIYRINADGSNLIRLTDSSAADYEAVWSPDGRQIAFVSERDGNAEIYVMDGDGTDQTRLTANNSADVSPAWSPDGQWIAFVARRDGNAEIYLMSADGSEQRRLTVNEVEDLNPVWQPNPNSEE